MDLFRSRLNQIINMNHKLVRLAQTVSWETIEARCGAVYSDGPGMRPLPTRLMAGAIYRTSSANPSTFASRVLERRQNQRGKKIYSLHVPGVECIGKGKAHAPYEFGVKVSVATTLQRSKGGQFALHAMALPRNPYDGHTLATVIPDIEQTIGNGIPRILADAGYRGHSAPLSHRFKVYTSGQKPRMTPAFKREMRRRSGVEPVIGHIKNVHRMDRNYLAGPQGDAINTDLAAAGYNFRLILNWLRLLLCLIAGLILLHSSSAHKAQIA